MVYIYLLTNALKVYILSCICGYIYISCSSVWVFVVVVALDNRQLPGVIEFNKNDKSYTYFIILFMCYVGLKIANIHLSSLLALLDLNKSNNIPFIYLFFDTVKQN